VASVGLGAAGAFLAPAYNAIIADLVPPDILRAGNATRLLGRSVARIAGPSVGGLTVALAGPALAFGIDALTFLFSFVTLLLANPAWRLPSPSAPILREIRDGLAYVVSVPWLRATIVYFMLVNIAFAGQSGVMTPLLVRDELGGGAEMYGAISTAYGVGTIVASVVVAQLTVRKPGRLLYVFEILACVSVLLIGLLPSLPVVVVLMAVVGVGLASSTVIWQALIQRHVPDRMRGRVSSIDLLGNSLINPLAPIAAAALVSALGPAATFVVAGGYATVLALIGLVASPLRALVDPPIPPNASSPPAGEARDG
jgi:MFS family permease